MWRWGTWIKGKEDSAVLTVGIDLEWFSEMFPGALEELSLRTLGFLMAEGGQVKGTVALRRDREVSLKT